MLLSGTDEHVSHEETMVGSGTDDSDFDSVARIPPGISIKDVNSRAGIEVIDCSLTIDLPDGVWHGFIYRSPPDIFGR